jgi:hypothetical protein
MTPVEPREVPLETVPPGQSPPVLETPETAVQPLSGPPPVEPDREGLSLLASGRCRVEFEGKTFTFRRPSFNELLEFADRAEAADEAVASNPEPRKVMRVQMQEQEKLARWLFERFADKRLPEDPPSWITSLGLIGQIRNHWQTVPNLPGSA